MSEEKTKTVHFTLDPSIVSLIRDEWAQWNFEWCLDVLDDFIGLDEDQKLGMLAGKYSFAEKDGEYWIVEDNWEPDPDMCRFSEWFNPYVYIRGMESVLKMGKERIKKVKEEIIQYVNMYNAEPHTIEAERIAKDLESLFTKEEWELVGIPYAIVVGYRRSNNKQVISINLDLVQDYLIDDFWKTYSSQPTSPITGENYSGVQKQFPKKAKVNWWEDLDAYFEHERQLNERELEKDKNFESVNGIITPDGIYWKCGFMEHSWLEFKLLEHIYFNFESWTFIKCSQSQINQDVIGYAVGFQPNGLRYEPTKKQKDTLLGWCQKYNISYEEIWERNN